MELRKILTEALDKHTITKISVFDFDGTLIDTPLPDKGKITHQEKTGKPWPHKGWWSKPESLDATIFDMPLIQSVINTYKEEKASPNTLIVMMTGRIPRLSKEVEAILKSKGLTFDKYIYNMGGATVDSKVNSLNKLLSEYPKVTDILLNDDRVEHIPAFEAWGEQQRTSGRITNFKINLVPSGHH